MSMQPQRTTAERLQRGALSINQIIVLMVILVAMLVVPVWIKRSQDNQEKEAQKARAEQAAKKARLAQASDPAETNPRPVGYGLTFAPAPAADVLPNNVAHVGCFANPGPLERPLEGSCNMVRGDTSCRVVLPVLCYKPDADPAPLDLTPQLRSKWLGGSLAATQPVMGAVLESEAFADARCEKEIGAGWAMASNARGFAILSAKGTGLLLPSRYWVNSKAHSANCWNSAP